VAAAVVGWIVLVLGTATAAALALLIQSLWPGSLVGWAIGLLIAVASLLFGVLLILAGRKLERHGVERQLGVKLEAVRALLSHRGGLATPKETASALAISESEADALLTELARESASDVRIDVDDDGQLRYDFRGKAAAFRVFDEALEARVPAAPDETELESPPGRTRARS
jgi:hypothetical protein